MVLSMYPHMYLSFLINTIPAWIIDVYHEQGNMIITNLLLPLGHISNTGTSTPSLSSKGRGEVEGELQQHDGVVEELAVLRQGFAKHY